MQSDELIPTRRSLLSRLRDWDDQQSWQQFFDTYGKLLYGVAIKAGLNETEAQDVVQETVLAVAKKMPEFNYDPSVGSFKSWLLLITRRRITDHWRKRGRQPATPNAGKAVGEDTARTSTIDRIPDEHNMEIDLIWDDEWQKNLFHTAIQRVRGKVDPKQFQIFDSYVLKQWSVKEVKKILGVSATQVYLAKHRISSLIKKEMKALEANAI